MQHYRSVMRLACLILSSVLIGGPSIAAPQSTQLTELAGVQGGLIVQVGLGGAPGGEAGERLGALRVNDGCLVHGLDTDSEVIREVRTTLLERGLSGSVSADTFDGHHLPYVDNLVNLLIVTDGASGVPDEELARVLAPGGAVLLHAGRSFDAPGFVQREASTEWSARLKKVPANQDAWPHYLHGPDNNAVANDTRVGPPRHLQWVGGPEWTRNHHKLNSISAGVTEGGRLFYIVDEATSANLGVPGKWSLLARDAYSGVQLWKKPLASWAWHGHRFRSGPPQMPRLLVASGDALYVPLGLSESVSKLDAVTGETVKTYADTVGAEELIVVGDVLLVLTGSPVAEHAGKHPEFKDRYQYPNRKSLLAVDTETGSALWQWTASEANPKSLTLASDGDRVYMQLGNGVIALNLSDGAPVWSYGQTAEHKRHELTFGKYTLVVSDGVVLCNLSGTVTALAADSGKELWKRVAAKHGFHAPLDIFVIDGRVWLGSNRPDSVAPPAEQDFNQGFDLRTGEAGPAASVFAELQTAGHHHRCHRERATTRYILTGKRGVEMMDLLGDGHFRANWVRGSCQFGFLPANGLLYMPPHSCGCYMESKLRGFNALASRQAVLSSAERRVTDDARLTRGPAFGQEPGSQPASAESWPTYRQNALRQGIASTQVPATLKQAWSVDIGGRLTQPVVAGGKVVVASIDRHTVVALNGSDGAVAWTFACGGRVDSPPTLYEGRVLFGSADGCVYCLSLETGELAWRFTCAPMDLRTVSYDQVESLWPAHGSVLVLDGVAYCSAGRSTWLDGGICFYALDPITGRLLHSHRFESRDPEYAENKDQAQANHDKRVDQNVTDYKTHLHPDRSDAFSMAGGAISDVLVSDGTDLYLHHARFNTRLEPQEEMSRHLFSTSSLLDDTENHRSHWVLGTGDFSLVPVAYSWIANAGGAQRKGTALVPPSGLMLVYDSQAVWGVHRNGKSDGKYSLSKRANEPLREDRRGQPDFAKLAEGEDPYPFEWRNPLQGRPRALVKAGSLLFVAATATDAPDGDPHAPYEERTGGVIQVIDAQNGQTVGALELASPVVWDGMAAADHSLYATTHDGNVVCLGK